MNKHVLIKQRDITDCGAACLASIAANYKFEVTGFQDSANCLHRSKGH